MKNLIKLKVIIFFLFFVALTKKSQAQDYPKNYFGVYFASGEYDLYEDLTTYTGIYNVYYFRPGISYARRVSKSLYLGIRTHKLEEDYRYSEFFIKANLLTRYRVQPHVGVTIGKVTDYGLMPNISSGFDFHVGNKMVINTFTVVSLTEYVYHFGLGLSYKF